MITEIVDWFKSILSSEEPGTTGISKPSKPKSDRKTPDLTFINTDQKRFIREAFEAHEAYNDSLPRSKQKTQDDLRNELNTILGLNKSTSSYRRIWKEEEH